MALVRKLLVLLAVLIALVVGADLAGRALAQSRAAAEVSRHLSTGASSGATVTIHGFSFLAQAIPGHYQHITLTASDVAAGPVTGIRTTIELYDVRFPLADALHGDTGNLVAGRATVRGLLAASAVTAAIPRSGAVVSAGGDGTIRVSTTVSILGQRFPVTADLLPSFANGVLRLTAADVRAAGIAVPNIDQLTRDLSLSLPLTGLPFALDGATLTSSGTDLVLTATAYAVSLHSLS